MITLKTLKGSSQGVASYLCEEQKLLEGYYADGGKSASTGVYVGGESLGLNGTAVGGEFSKMLEGKRPDGAPIYHIRKSEKRRLGFDLTLSPDKSISVLWARLDGEGRSRL
jgi:conjugative relaxase-like TrwC/TraI family protein